MKLNERLWVISRDSKDVWFENDSSMCSMYFPKAQWLLTNYPWIAVRIFYICIKFREILRKYNKLGHYNYF
jgi:hypothetical protein